MRQGNFVHSEKTTRIEVVIDYENSVPISVIANKLVGKHNAFQTKSQAEQYVKQVLYDDHMARKGRCTPCR